MRMHEYSFSDIEKAVGSETGLGISVSNLLIRVHSRIAQVSENIYNLYAHYPVTLQPEYSDFSIRLYPARGLRRWFRAQVHFALDEFVPFKPLPLNQAYAFFEWGMNWCIAQYYNQSLILHAAVVEKNGKGLILPAAPGSGKSTLCAILVANGWRLLSDEMAIIDLQSGDLKALPRPISLKNQSIDLLKHLSPHTFFSPTTHDTNKGSVAHMQVDQSAVDAAGCTPAWFVIPRYAAAQEVNLEPMTPGVALMSGVENSFNYSVLGLPAFRILSQLLTRLPAYRFSYSETADALNTFNQLAASVSES